MLAAVVNRIPRRRKIRIAEGADGNGDGSVFISLLGMENRRSTDGAEAEPEFCAPIAGANIFRCRAMNPVGRRETGESGKDASGAALTGKAVTDADPLRFAVNFDPQLAACAGCRSRPHADFLYPACFLPKIHGARNGIALCRMPSVHANVTQGFIMPFECACMPAMVRAAQISIGLPFCGLCVKLVLWE